MMNATKKTRKGAAKKPRKRSIVPILLLLLLGAGIWQSWQWWAWANAAPITRGVVPASKSVKLKISQGTSAQEIGRDLETLGLIRSKTAWNIWTRWLTWKDPKGGFQAGTYQISPMEPMQTIAAKIWSGDIIRRSFTIPEGWSLRKMAAYFEEQKFFSAQEFITAAQQFPVANHPWLPTNVSSDQLGLEGYLYPDTYEVGGTPTPQDILEQMLNRFEQVAMPLYQQAEGKTSLKFSQWVTLASIVEKEAAVPQERPLIAGVFLNRLEKGIPLGADPTIEYGLGIQQTPDKTLTFEQVRTASPYNTYLNTGLPPTPIASPGLASLKAVLYPEKTDYLFFVARYDGTHIFSRTFKEHQAAQEAIHNQREAAQPKH
jgi:UPF0755 protein